MAAITKNDHQQLMLLTYERDRGILEMGGIEYQCTCIVRNELNGWRKEHEIVAFVPPGERGAYPYMPRPFPLGLWNVTRVVKTDNPEYAPYFIRTDAVQELDLWETKINRDTGRKEYLKPSGVKAVGDGYGFHHAMFFDGEQWRDSNTTLGCGNIKNINEARYIGTKIQSWLDAGHPVKVRVV